MKAKSPKYTSWLLGLTLSFLSCQSAFSQGRVIINEYLPWPNNGCGATAEFIELLNMGPGPMDIGCYIITDGDYTITIPPGTILAPGQFYVIAGQDTIRNPCANIHGDIIPNLNWNYCNCTNLPIPTTGDGFLTDGGAANEQVVLLDPNLNVVDAVARSFPVESSSMVDNREMGDGRCSYRLFNIADFNIQYETIGESAGRGNSFARLTDGACDWVKDTQQSAGETNNAPNEQPFLRFNTYYTELPNCEGGNAVFHLLNEPSQDYFPMNYILAFDANNDGQFTQADTYTYGTDLSPSFLEVMNLPIGRYSISISPQQDCDIRNFNFVIGPCAPLSVALRSFTGNITGDKTNLNAAISGCNELASVELEVSTNGIDFQWLATLPLEKNKDYQEIKYSIPETSGKFYRLNMISQSRVARFSPVLHLRPQIGQGLNAGLSPNPFRNNFQISYSPSARGRVRIDIIKPDGQAVHSQLTEVSSGLNQIQVSTGMLPRGMYFVRVAHLQTGETQTFKAIKE